MGAIIVRYSEIGLKGGNRLFFERKLVANIKDCIKSSQIGYAPVKRIRGRIIVEGDKELLPHLARVFGIATLSYAEVCEPDYDIIKKEAFAYALERIESYSTFRVTCQKVNAKYPVDSMVMEREIGDSIYEGLHKKVDLKNPEFNLQIEVADKAYIFHERLKAFAGLPIGTEGRVVVVIEGGELLKQSILAALLVMKRGCAPYPFFIGKKSDAPDVSVFERYAYGSTPQLRIVNSISEISKDLAGLKVKGVVVCDRLDSLDESRLKEEARLNSLILRPLIGLSDEEISEHYTNYGLD